MNGNRISALLFYIEFGKISHFLVCFHAFDSLELRLDQLCKFFLCAYISVSLSDMILTHFSA